VFEDFLPTFAAMEKHDIVLNLHGEVPHPVLDKNISLEEAFLPTLKNIHQRFPNLRIVLEHCSTAAALEAVRACGPTVTGSFFTTIPASFSLLMLFNSIS
jgi:dihydroorotase